MSIVGDGIEFRRIFWTNGPSPGADQRRAQAVTDPPCSGWSSAFIIRGEKRSTLFCPYSFNSYLVPNNCAELVQSVDTEFDAAWHQKNFPGKWKECQAFGFSRDYDTAALILRRLGWPVPETVLRGGEVDDRKKGGKEVSAKLEKQVKLKGKRGQFLLWFLEGGCSRSVREAMAEFGMTRSNALSYLFMIQKDHGIGYTLVGDMAHIKLPEGVTNPFDVEWSLDGVITVEAGADLERGEPVKLVEGKAVPAISDDEEWLK